jgi:PAS domain-containing protein
MSNEELTLPSEEQTSLNPEKQNLLASENFGNELLMKNIFNVLPAGIIYLDHEYYVQYINKLGCQVINVDENDYILGKIFFELKTTIQLPNLKIAFQKIKSSNQPITLWGYPVPKRLNSDDGEASFSSGDKTQGDLSKYSYWDLTLYPLVNVNKNNVGVLLFAIEVTDRVRLERGMQDSINNVKQTAHKLESLIHQMSDGVIVCDADANVVTINDAAITMLGAATSAVTVSKPETTPLLWRTDQQPFPANEYPWRTACLYGQTSINVEIMINKHLHEQTIISVNAAPLKDDNGNLSGSISFCMMSQKIAV